jgi:ABC-type microcin C transport system duplicated ATPase subunit YejF
MTFPTDITPQKLLKIEDLVLHFKTRGGTVQAVDGVDFELDTNRAVVILGDRAAARVRLPKPSCASCLVMSKNTAAKSTCRAPT